METQAISAPANRLTREAPKPRQVGYGLPCAKCHKYFPADLEVCPICKGRERVSPVVAPKIPKPVRSEPSAAPPSANAALTPEVEKSPKLESATLAPPIEIKVRVKEQPLDQKESITTPVVAEPQIAVETVPSSGASAQAAESQKPLESPALAVPVEIQVQVKDQLLEQRESTLPPTVAKLQVAVETVPSSVTLEPEENEEEVPKELETAAIVAPAATRVREKAQSFIPQALIAAPMIPEFPVVAEVQIAVERPAIIVAPVEAQCLVEDEPVTIPTLNEVQAAIEPAADPETTNAAESATDTESPMFASSVEGSVKGLSLDQVQKLIAIPTPADVQSSAAPVTESSMPVQADELSKELGVPEAAAPVRGVGQDERLDGQLKQEEPIAIVTAQPPAAPVAETIATVLEEQPVPTAAVPALEAEALTNQMESPASAVSPQIAVEDQRPDEINQAGPIVIPATLEAQAYDPVPANVAQVPEEKEFPQESESESAFAPPVQKIEEDHCLELLYPAEPIVIPAPADTQAYEPTPAAAEQKKPEQEKKKEVPVMLETPTTAAEAKIASSPAAHKETPHRSGEEKFKDKVADAPPKPADVSAPVVVHVNLGELRPSKGTPDRLPALTRFKEIEPKKPETSKAAISPDAYTSEPPLAAGNLKFDVVTFALGVVVVACAVLLITLASLRLMPHRVSTEPVRRAKPAYSVAPTADQGANSSTPAVPTALPPSPAQTPSANVISSSAQPGRTLTLTPGLAEGNLLYRVEPDYPEEARRQGIQGPVVMDLHINRDGAVQGVDLVSGQPLLAQAAAAAVKQWRFRTRYVNGNEVEMLARITLHFALPTP